MRKIHLAMIPIILSNPFHTYSRKIIDTCYLNTSSLQANLEDNLHLNSNDLMSFVLVNAHQDLNDNNIEFTNNIKNTLFHKPGSSYTERTDSKGKRKSNIESTLVFRQKTKSNNGRKEVPKGASSAINPENLANFEKAGIPIDPIRDPRQKPDSHNSWSWHKEENRWILVGEQKMLIRHTSKVISESEWNDLVRKSKKI
uniref:Uncharacterized protein n=1 Tax=Gracilaria firma TaxID=2510791 RepID=A0A1P8D6L2_9FLOR|nr:hypothetical protein [Gracilaria firma]APR74440.1 hypothetical protein [Gracilaria firma]